MITEVENPETPDDEFLARVGTDLDKFAEALFAESVSSSWIGRMARFSRRADWAELREALLRASQVDACVRRYEPKPRCVVERLLRDLGRTGTDEAIARLVHIAAASPQLRLHALHALLEAGPKGVDAAAGSPGDPPPTDGQTAHLRARAALVRGDRLEQVWRGGPAWKNGVLRALVTKYASGPVVGTSELMASDTWLAVVVDALFDPELADSAEVVLGQVPKARWRPLVAARKEASTKTAPVKPPKPTAKELAVLDDELTRIGGALTAAVEQLRAAGYEFQGEPLRPPTKRFATKLRRLEKRIGNVPLALARFWALVGEVDLRGNHPAWAKKTWVATGSDDHWLADPLVVSGLDDALAEAEDSDFDVEEASDVQRYRLALSGDDLTKANFSGGMIRVLTPAIEVDPELEGHEGTFLSMLREAVAWRGFPGFAAISGAPVTRDRGGGATSG